MEEVEEDVASSDSGYELHELIFAESLGVSLEEDNVVELLDIAAKALYILPDDWELDFTESEMGKIPFFYDTVNDESHWIHPYLKDLKDLIEEKRQELAIEAEEEERRLTEAAEAAQGQEVEEKEDDGEEDGALPEFVDIPQLEQTPLQKSSFSSQQEEKSEEEKALQEEPSLHFHLQDNNETVVVVPVPASAVAEDEEKKEEEEQLQQIMMKSSQELNEEKQALTDLLELIMPDKEPKPIPAAFPSDMDAANEAKEGQEKGNEEAKETTALLEQEQDLEQQPLKAASLEEQQLLSLQQQEDQKEEVPPLEVAVAVEQAKEEEQQDREQDVASPLTAPTIDMKEEVVVIEAESSPTPTPPSAVIVAFADTTESIEQEPLQKEEEREPMKDEVKENDNIQDDANEPDDQSTAVLDESQDSIQLVVEATQEPVPAPIQDPFADFFTVGVDAYTLHALYQQEAKEVKAAKDNNKKSKATNNSSNESVDIEKLVKQNQQREIQAFLLAQQQHETEKEMKRKKKQQEQEEKEAAAAAQAAAIVAAAAEEQARQEALARAAAEAEEEARLAAEVKEAEERRQKEEEEEAAVMLLAQQQEKAKAEAEAEAEQAAEREAALLAAALAEAAAAAEAEAEEQRKQQALLDNASKLLEEDERFKASHPPAKLDKSIDISQHFKNIYRPPTAELTPTPSGTANSTVSYNASRAGGIGAGERGMKRFTSTANMLTTNKEDVQLQPLQPASSGTAGSITGSLNNIAAGDTASLASTAGSLRKKTTSLATTMETILKLRKARKKKAAILAATGTTSSPNGAGGAAASSSSVVRHKDSNGDTWVVFHAYPSYREAERAVQLFERMIPTSSEVAQSFPSHTKHLPPIGGYSSLSNQPPYPDMDEEFPTSSKPAGSTGNRSLITVLDASIAAGNMISKETLLLSAQRELPRMRIARDLGRMQWLVECNDIHQKKLFHRKVVKRMMKLAQIQQGNSGVNGPGSNNSVLLSPLQPTVSTKTPAHHRSKKEAGNNNLASPKQQMMIENMSLQSPLNNNIKFIANFIPQSMISSANTKHVSSLVHIHYPIPKHQPPPMATLPYHKSSNNNNYEQSGRESFIKSGGGGDEGEDGFEGEEEDCGNQRMTAYHRTRLLNSVQEAREGRMAAGTGGRGGNNGGESPTSRKGPPTFRSMLKDNRVQISNNNNKGHHSHGHSSKKKSRPLSASYF